MSRKKTAVEALDPGYVHRSLVEMFHPEILKDNGKKLKAMTTIDRFDAGDARVVAECKGKMQSLGCWSHKKWTVQTTDGSVGQYAISLSPGKHVDWFFMNDDRHGAIAIRVNWEEVLMKHIHDSGALIVNGLNTSEIEIQKKKKQ